ncbi:hypothetical protein ACJ3XI_09320 [Litorimonas sp. RW-G-Af-16]|uniref:hypothetical protein n=1 Tax=Litorimonas sp. RW-G-Af-16 TaxID=3241168 RepID=UPI00390C669D
MSNEDEILSPSDQVDVDTVEDGAKPAKGIGFPVFALGLLLASALGAAGGGVIANMLQPDAVNVTPLRNDVSQLKASISGIEKQQADLTQAITMRPAMPDISGLEARLSALETAPLPTFDIPELDEDALAQLKAAQDAGFEWPDADLIAKTLAAMANRIEALEADLDSRPVFDPAMVTPPAPTLAVPSSEPIISEAAQPIPFPKSAMLLALNNTKDQGGFFARMRQKHIRVKDSDDPEVIINGIETAIASGDIETAKAKFDALPSTLRSVGQNWRKSLN